MALIAKMVRGSVEAADDLSEASKRDEFAKAVVDAAPRTKPRRVVNF